MCATTTLHSTKTGTMPIGLIARQANGLLEDHPYRQPAPEAKAKGHQDHAILNALGDLERSDPEHVWGDEGPING